MVLAHFQYQEQRVIAIYTINVKNPVYLRQLFLFNKDSRGLKERDIVIKKYVLKNNEARFKQYHIKSNFVITLTGKDGSEKLRSSNEVSIEKLFSIIDAMPMRKEEMKIQQQ